ncbi:MMPL family transporter [Parvibaculum sp.]|uniref:efflux RND transporter permease subunit n=1 Tax=Parvibaculum sp. TaxID=2024848 RepID=UPI000C977857|nr:MMPL family transporter [Parvibaculum sp.]MAB12836.1 RND transporter [Parvibaculum sp.]
MNEWVVTYLNWVVRWRWLVLILSAGAALALASGGRFIEFSNDYRYFFTDENPNLLAFEELERTYSSPDTLLWVLQPDEGTVDTPEVLAIVKQITEDAWQTPFSVRVDSITNYQHTRASEDDLIVRDLVPDPAALTAESAKEVGNIATSEPVTAKRLISDDRRTTAIVARLNMPRDDVAANNSVVEHARGILADMRAQHPDIRFELTGSVMLSNAFSEAATRDLQTLTPAMYLILAVTVYLLLRSFSGTLVTMAVVFFSAFAAMGLVLGWMGVKLTPPSSGAPTIILTIAVADAIHILVTMLVQMRHGMTRNEAIVEAMRVNWQPVFLTSMTTAIGFLSLNFSDAPPFRDLGNISAAGAVIAWVLSVTLLPALVAVLPFKAKASIVNQSRVMENLGDFIIRHNRVLMGGVVLTSVGFAVLLPRFVFDDRFVTYFDDRMEFRVASDWAADNLTGIYQISHSIPAQESGGVSDPAYLKHLEAFADWFRAQPEVVHVATFSDVIKRVNKSMHADNEDWYRVPDDRQAAAQFLLLYEMSLPYGLDLNDQLNVDKSASKLTLTLHDISTSQMEDLRERAMAWQEANLPPYMISQSAGQSVMFSFIGESNFRAMAVGTLFALLLISACLMLALRDLKLGLISLVTNIAPPVVAFGILALFRPEVGLWSSFVIATALGLIVDATVHFLSKYKRARDEFGYSAEEGVRYAFATVGTALWVSGFVLVAGFGILAFSPFKINAMLGIMVALTIAVALIIDFLLLPGLLIALDRNRKSKSHVPVQVPGEAASPAGV